jgi:hypothetical protein
MAKRTTKKAPAKKSRTSFRAIKRQAKAGAAAEKPSTKRASAKAPTTLIGPEARRDERFRELVAWYMLQGLDEATERRRALLAGAFYCGGRFKRIGYIDCR